MSYFPQPYNHSKKTKFKVKLDLSYYTTKIRFKKSNRHRHIKVCYLS